MKKILLASTALVGMTAIAYAQTATNTVDISPISNYLIEIVGTILSGVAVWVGVAIKAWVSKKTGLADSQMAESLQARYNEAVARGMAYAESKAKGAIPGEGKVEIDNAFVREAAEYVVEMWPDIAKTMNLDAIAKSVIARLPTGVFTDKAEAIAAKQPVTVVSPVPSTVTPPPAAVVKPPGSTV